MLLGEGNAGFARLDGEAAGGGRRHGRLLALWDGCRELRGTAWRKRARSSWDWESVKREMQVGSFWKACAVLHIVLLRLP